MLHVRCLQRETDPIAATGGCKHTVRSRIGWGRLATSWQISGEHMLVISRRLVYICVAGYANYRRPTNQGMTG
jgi:hypothetical protein